MPRPPDDAAPEDGGGARRIQAVDRAIELLKAVSESRTPRSVGDLARACGLNRSTAWRLLMTLEHHGLIDRDPITDRYVIGFELLRLGAGASAHDLIASRAYPVMDALAQETGESVSLVVRTPRGIVAVEQCDARNVATVSVVGVHLPLHATASGKLWLAHMAETEREGLANPPLAQLAERTIVDPGALAAELERVRRQGFAVERDEFEDGISGLAAPLFDPQGQVIASISIWGLTAQLPAARLRELAPQIRAAAASTGDRLHFGGPRQPPAEEPGDQEPVGPPAS